MPAPETIDAFLELGYKSGLLEAKAIEAYRQAPSAGVSPETAKQFADALVRDGLLSHFQAEKLLEGRWGGFLIAGKYRVIQPLGQGGMGCVYLCEHTRMKRRVELKVLTRSQAKDRAAVERFYLEARAVAALDHPNIIRAHDVDHDGELHFIVLEYVDGTNLHDIVRKHGAMNVIRAAHYIRQAALGLQHAHEAGLVHRDIKPGNLLLDRNGTVKLLDMGLARFFREEMAPMLRDQEVGNALGTAEYLAPEQVDDSMVDIRADLYSLGVTMYYMLAGKSPFQQGTMAQKLIWQQVRQPKRIRELRPEVPEELARTLEKMMAKEVRDRFQTPLEVIEALSPWTQTMIAPPPEEEMPPREIGERGPGSGPRGAGSWPTPREVVGPATPGARIRPASSQPPAVVPKTPRVGIGPHAGPMAAAPAAAAPPSGATSASFLDLTAPSPAIPASPRLAPLSPAPIPLADGPDQASAEPPSTSAVPVPPVISHDSLPDLVTEEDLLLSAKVEVPPAPWSLPKPVPRTFTRPVRKPPLKPKPKADHDPTGTKVFIFGAVLCALGVLSLVGWLLFGR